MSTRALSPTLIALACAAFGGVRLDAATASERDQHFVAIEALIAAQLRLPGERQLAEFEKAGYPDDGWHRKTLRWYFADVFKTEITDQAKAKALEGQATALRGEIEAADKGGTLPEVPKALFSGAGDATSRTVNDVGQIVKPDGVEPLVISPEAQAKVRRQVEFLVDSAGKRFAAAVAKVKANADKEKGIWDFPDNDPKGQALIKEATFLRADALRALYVPHIILREVVTRGRDFGLDPEPAAKMLATVLKEHAKTIEDWDYNFGDYMPPLKMQANVLLGEAIRQKVGGEVKLEAVEAELQKVIDQKLDGYSREAKEGIIDLQIKAWAALIKLRTELGGDRNLLKGEEFWRAWLADRGRESGMKPGANNGFSREVGGLYIAAARLLAAKGDKAGAQALLGQVVANKKQPQWHNASDWLRKLSGGGASTGSGDSWGQPVVPADPSQALVVAQALIRAAKETADAKLAQSQIQSAAIQLRAAVMGLSAGWEDQFSESGAEVYNAYASALNQLGLRIHAAIAAAEGLKAVKAKVAAAPKGANPYRTGPKQEWNEQGRKVAILARNGLVFASNLSSRLKGPGAQAMASDLFEAVKQVAPEEFGKGSEWNFIVAKLQEGDWNGAIDQAGKYRKNYPEDTVKVFGVITSALLQKYNQARGTEDRAAMGKAADEMRSFSGEIKGYIAQQKSSKAGLTAEQQRDLQKAANTIESMDIQVLMGDGKFDEVIKRLGPDYWKNPPADETLFAQMLRNMAQAVQRQERERVKDPARKADPKALIALWPTYQFAYDTYAKMLPRIKDPEEKRKARFAGKLLADLFVLDTFLAESLGKAADAPPELAAIAIAAKRGMADLLEPDMGPEDKPENLLGVGTALWELGDHGRAVRLLELFVKKAGENAELAAFREDPKPVLDAAEATVIGRPELKSDWARLRDLVEDKPGFKDEREKVERASWSEQPADFAKALQDLRKFRVKVAEMKLKMGDGYAKADTALAKLDSLLGTAVREAVVSKRLAQGWRETGKIDQARDLYLKLYAQDPDDPVVATAVVDITVDQIKNPGPKGAPDKATIEKAELISRKIRDESGNDQVLYWTAAIQVYELNAALGTKENLATINKGLKYDSVNQSDPSWTLVSPRVSPDARQAGDRKDVRRAANALAVDLAKRYLALYQLPGVTQKPTYKLDAVQIDGKEQVVFVNLDSAPMTVVPAVTEDEREVFIITDEDSIKAFEKAKAAREEAERLAAAAATAAATSATAAAQPAATAAQPK